MTLDQFARLVADMREAQREYFRTRSSTALDRSKRLERQVDQAIKDHADGPSLFDRSESTDGR